MSELQDENFLDAYELIGCPEPDVRDFVHSLPVNLGNKQRYVPTEDYLREDVAKRMGKILAKVVVQNMSVDEIIGLNNLANMPEDPYMFMRLKDIRGKDGYKEAYIKEMQLRDKRDYREREFPLEPILEAIENGTCRPPLVMELDSGRYVIDGRTRLYAAIASNKSLDVRVVNTETFGGLNDEN